MLDKFFNPKNELKESAFSYLDKHFVIRVTPDKGKSFLLSSRQLFSMLEKRTRISVFKSALTTQKQTYTKKLRSGSKIDFVSK